MSEVPVKKVVTFMLPLVFRSSYSWQCLARLAWCWEGHGAMSLIATAASVDVVAEVVVKPDVVHKSALHQNEENKTLTRRGSAGRVPPKI